MTIDHTTCSGLLPSYVKGELSAEQTEQVTEHLSGCDECRLEERAVRALLADLPDEDLKELESARLHREVWAAVRPAAEIPRKSLGARLAPYLGAAAALVLLAVGIVYGGLTTSGGDDEGAADGGGAVLEDAADSDTSSRGGATLDYRTEGELEDAGRDEAAEEEQGVPNAATESGVAGAAGGASGAAPVFDGSGGSYSAASLDRTGRRGYPFTSYAQDYSANEAAQMQSGFLDQLASQAGGAESLIRACGRTVIDALGSTALPAWAALGSYGGRDDALIFGVAVTSGGSDLDRFAFWVFDRSECSEPVKVLEGRIGT